MLLAFNLNIGHTSLYPLASIAAAAGSCLKLKNSYLASTYGTKFEPAKIIIQHQD